jgi:hypothetical protein
MAAFYVAGEPGTLKWSVQAGRGRTTAYEVSGAAESYTLQYPSACKVVSRAPGVKGGPVSAGVSASDAELAEAGPSCVGVWKPMEGDRRALSTAQRRAVDERCAELPGDVQAPWSVKVDGLLEHCACKDSP